MTAPNLKSLTTVNGKSAVLAATTTETDLIAAVATGHMFVVEAIFVTNIHATSSGRITVVQKRSGTDWRVAKTRLVAIRTTINVILGKPLYLEEGDSVRVFADADSVLEVVAPYSDMTDL